MDKSKILSRIQEIYDKGENIIQHLKDLNSKNDVTTEDILISYDLQAGQYIKRFRQNTEGKNLYTASIAREIDSLGKIDSMLEVGVGEATTLGKLVEKMSVVPAHVFGFDLSWSRIKYAQTFLASLKLDTPNRVQLCTGDLFNSPFADNAFDLVYTSHSIEPNGGLENEALEALYRITNKYLILLEPAYELASDEAKERMNNHGYVKNLKQTALDLGYNVVKHELFEHSVNPLNPTGILIIKKDTGKTSSPSFVCPNTKKSLVSYEDALFSKESLLAYPILNGVPCLLPSNGIVATHFLDQFS